MKKRTFSSQQTGEPIKLILERDDGSIVLTSDDSVFIRASAGGYSKIASNDTTIHSAVLWDKHHLITASLCALRCWDLETGRAFGGVYPSLNRKDEDYKIPMAVWTAPPTLWNDKKPFLLYGTSEGVIVSAKPSLEIVFKIPTMSAPASITVLTDRTIVCCDANGLIERWFVDVEKKERKLLQTAQQRSSLGQPLEWIQGEVIAVPSDYLVRIFDFKTSSLRIEERRALKHQQHVKAIAKTSSGWLVCSTLDYLQIWSMKGLCLTTIKTHNATGSVAVLRNDDKIAVGRYDGKLGFYSAPETSPTQLS